MFVLAIKKCMLEKKISIEEIVKLTNLDKEYIQKLVNNEINDINLNTLNKVAEALEVEVKDLFYFEYEYVKVREQLDLLVKQTDIKDEVVVELGNILNLLYNIRLNKVFPNNNI